MSQVLKLKCLMSINQSDLSRGRELCWNIYTLLWSDYPAYATHFAESSPAESILKSRTLSIPLRGIALGNPWIDGRSQYSSYVEYAVHHGFLTEGSTVSNESVNINKYLKLTAV